MVTQPSKSVVIAGGGLAGLAAAMYLDELGFDITLVEKKPIFGGRTFSFVDKKTGTTIDNGQHLLIGAYHETIKLLERVGTKHKIPFLNPQVVPLVDEEGNRADFSLSDFKPPLGLFFALLRFKNFSFFDKLKLIRLGIVLKLIQSGEIKSPKNLTVNEWLKSVGQSERTIKNFWEPLTLATLNDSPDVASADALVTVLIKSFLRARTMGNSFCQMAVLTRSLCSRF